MVCQKTSIVPSTYVWPISFGLDMMFDFELAPDPLVNEIIPSSAWELNDQNVVVSGALELA